MKKLLVYATFLIFIQLCSFHLSYCQNRAITGKLINAISGNPISGIKVELSDSHIFTLSDSLGEYSIIVPDTLKTIHFSDFDGMILLETKVVDIDVIDFYLSEIDFSNLSLEQLFNVKVTVSSTKALNVFDSPSAISVIDREMISQYNFLSIAEMLRNVAGFDIYQTNIDDNLPTARGILQNYYANKILIMIDKVPVWQPIYGNTNLDRISVNDVERIEVLRGPASVLYGSNAFVGVVNIVLRKADSDKTNIRIGAGYHRFGSSGANISLRKKSVDLFISGNSSFEIQKPYDVMGKRQDLFHGDSVYRFQNEIKSTNFNFLGSFKAFSLLMNTYEYQHGFLGINPSFISGGGKQVSDKGTLLSMKYEKDFNEKFNFKTNIAYDFFKRNYPSSDNGSTELVLSGTRILGSALFNYQAANFMNIELGVNAEQRICGGHKAINVLNDSIIHDNISNSDNIYELSTFAQIDFKTLLFDFLGGVRYTKNSIAGNNVSGRFTFAYHINEINSLKFILGQSYRAPTMLELYFNHPTVIGNKDLKPEKASSIELVYVFGSKYFFMQMLTYYSKYEQLIQRFTPLTGPPSQYQNLSSFKGYGIELEAKYQNTSILNAFISYNYMNGLGKDANLNYQHIPSHTIRAGINKVVNAFFISANCYAVSSVVGNPKLMIQIPSQFMLDFHVGYKQVKNLKKINIVHTFSAKNITGGQMLIPEYIRQTDNINSQATTGFGRRFIYTISLTF